jgi:enoyl-CoA hydratase
MPDTETRTPEEMMTYEKDRENKIATLTIDRPEILNAPDSAMRMRYAELLHRANIDDDVKVLVIRGAGDHFGSGADLPEQQIKMNGDANGEGADPLFELGYSGDPDIAYPPKGSFRYGYNIGSHYASVRGGCRSLQEFKKISIVEVKGYCYGWHFYQAGDADLVVASDDALFGHAAFRYVGWGPRLWTWVETMGLRQFQEMVFTGRPFTAQQMMACGFLNSVVTRSELEDEVHKYAMACAHNGPTDRIAVQKTFFELYKQFNGEYFGSVLTGLVESMGNQVRPDEGEYSFNPEMMHSGLAKSVKEADKHFPPEWRLSMAGRRANS